jgi:3-hydroxymyristoyl/3-hydroxydecanoyl-(acyl carrier protein) dehydratase
MRWMWIDRIVAYEPGHRMAAVKCVSLAEEHLYGSSGGAPHLPAPFLIEGMAQTAGILAGAVHHFREKVILAKIVRAEFDAEARAGDVVRYDATLERIDDFGAATTGAVFLASPAEFQWRELGRIDLMFSHIDQNRAGIEFPKENFVFGENFRQILASAGLAGLSDAG